MKINPLLVISACLLAPGATLSAQSTCSVKALRGVYNGQCFGYHPPPNSSVSVPMACISQWKFDGAGTATGVLFCNTNGVNRTLDVRLTSITLSPDCTGEMEGTQVVKETGVTIPAKIKFITTPTGEEIRTLPVGVDVWSAAWQRVSWPWMW